METFTIRKLDGDLRHGIPFETEHAAICHAMKSNLSAIGVFRDDMELTCIVDCGRLYILTEYECTDTETSQPATPLSGEDA